MLAPHQVERLDRAINLDDHESSLPRSFLTCRDASGIWWSRRPDGTILRHDRDELAGPPDQEEVLDRQWYFDDESERSDLDASA